MKIDFISLRHPVVRIGAWLLFGIFLYFYLHLFKNALIDDAFITLRYVKTLLTSGTWGFFPGVVANSATSPLNILLLTFISLFTGPTEEASVWLYLLCTLCIAFLLIRFSRQLIGSEAYGWLAVFALTFNPLLISTVGMEGIVLTILFVFAIYFYQIQQWTLLGVVLGLLTLARPDGLLFFLVFFLFVPAGKIKLKLTVAYILCIAPWYLFSWIHLGSFVPDTFFIKTEQRSWFQWDFFNGIASLYYLVYPLETILSFAFLPLVTLLFHRNLRQATVLVVIALTGLIHFLAYSFLQVPPFHWYYVPQVMTIILLGSLGLGILYRNSNKPWQRNVLALVTVIYFLIPSVGMLYILRRDHFIVRQMPIHSNWGTFEQYKEIGLWLKANHEADTIRLPAGEIGTLAYYCDCQILDRFSDRGWLKDYIAEHISQPGIRPFLLRLNFLFYSYSEFPPQTYSLGNYREEPNGDIDILKEWITSTKWAGRVFVILSRE